MFINPQERDRKSYGLICRFEYTYRLYVSAELKRVPNI